MYISKLWTKINNRIEDNAIRELEVLRETKIKIGYGNLENNRQNFEKNHKEEIANNKGYIENQENYNDMRYGLRKFNKNGCEIIATKNAHNSLIDKDCNLPELIQDFEKDGNALMGVFGTSPPAIDEHFKKEKFDTVSSKNEKEFDKIEKETDTSILSYWNDKNNFFHKVHTVNLEKKDGKYYPHNVGLFSNIPYNSPSEFIEKNGGKGIYIVGINKKQKEEFNESDNSHCILF